ncbi:hypothetical protein [Methylobacterium sp. WL64]|uniref:hypothetical protein n=1 Tax=Methylobacterium sp. WL64 TaxID=2603894 RepID=UPI00164F6E3C|nr:hypothetical protein [Methylobacterium sp. WL64]
MTVTLAAWWIPLLITLALFAWAVLTPSHGTFDLGPILRLAGAAIGSLIAWLVWALWR